VKPIIFVAGMSRAGSMWTYNATRHLLKASGHNPLPENIPVDDQVAIQESMKRDPGRRGVFCFKTHRRIEPVVLEMKIICPYRDVRDAMYSYMKFMKCPFERALMAARSMMDSTDHYLQGKADNVLPLRYEEIVNHPEKVIGIIADFLQLKVADSVIKEITAALSRETMKKYLKGLDDIKVDEAGKLQSEAQASRYATVPRFDGSHRIYDHATGFQSNHITTGKDGEWRNQLELQQQKVLMELATPWLRKHGFPL